MELIVTLALLQSFPVQHSILHSSKVQLSYASKARVICAQAAALSIPKRKLSVNKHVSRNMIAVIVWLLVVHGMGKDTLITKLSAISCRNHEGLHTLCFKWEKSISVKRC